MSKIDLSLDFAGVKMKNPVVTVSGTCGFGREYEEYYKPSELGAIAVKGTTLEPREGNAPPRIAETPSGILNSIGLQNPGIANFVTVELPRLKSEGAVVIANIAGSTVEDYCRVAEILDSTDVDMIEMNISCPNVKKGGVAFGTTAAGVFDITNKVKIRTSKPLVVKLSPNVTDITETAKAAEAAGANAISLINTLLGMRIDIKTRRPILRNNVGGLSGPAVFPVAVRMVWQVRRAIGLPILGMGGISSAEDAIEMMIAGADVIGVGTAMFRNPRLPLEIIEGIEKFMENNNIKDLHELIGSVKSWE